MQQHDNVATVLWQKHDGARLLAAHAGLLVRAEGAVVLCADYPAISRDALLAALMLMLVFAVCSQLQSDGCASCWQREILNASCWGCMAAFHEYWQLARRGETPYVES